jgi:Carboxypeptidase regulatory-like domain
MKSLVLRAPGLIAVVCAGAVCLASPGPASGHDARSGAQAPAISVIKGQSAATGGNGTVGVRGTAVRGIASNADDTPIPGARLRLRNVLTGEVEASTVANELGQFAFTNVEGGSYLVELVTEGGRLLTVGHTFNVGPGQTVATFIRLGTKVPWFEGFFRNAAGALAAAAASTGVTAIAPEKRTCVSACAGQ